MSIKGSITYKFKSHKIHFFKQSTEGDYNFEELEPLPEKKTESIVNCESSSSKDSDSKTNKLKNSEKSEKNDFLKSEKNALNNDSKKDTNLSSNELINKNLDSFITYKKYDLVIGIAMYAEEFERIDSTLEGISRNFPALQQAGISPERILVSIISDGRDKINKEVFDTFINNNLETIEPKIDEYMKSEVFNSEAYKQKKSNYLISCLIERRIINSFETEINKKIIKMDILFSIKKENRGKLDSHHWLFAGFCSKISPEYLILLDTGTVPDLIRGVALSSLIIPMKNDCDIAGTCGEMELDNTINCSNLTLCAQFLEYKYAHVIDKHFEGLFGFISVLPGAFSAYRWNALNNSTTLSEYFKTIGNDKADCAMANRYLAEDRIFCWVLFAMQNQGNILRFIPDAMAKTDAPELFGEFMLQRRRWINGSNFAMYYVLQKFQEMYNTKHFVRQLFFIFLYIYYIIQAFLGYIILGTYYFVYYMICEKNFKKDSISTSIIMSIYLFIIIFTIIASLTVKPVRVVSCNKGNKEEEVKFKRRTIYVIMSFILALFNLAAFILGIYTIFNGSLVKPGKANFNTANEYLEAYKQYWGALLLAVVGLANYVFPLLYQPSMCCLWLNNFLQYLLFQPTYAIILNIFAVCNIDDVSWGNRDSKAYMSDDNFKKYKLKYLSSWLISNFILGWGFSYIVSNPESIAKGNDIKLINYFSVFVASLSAFKLIGAVLGKFKFYFIDKKVRKLMDFKNKKNINIKNNEEISQPKSPQIDSKEDSPEIFYTEKKALQADYNNEISNFNDNIYSNNNDKNNVYDIEKAIVSEDFTNNPNNRNLGNIKNDSVKNIFKDINQNNQQLNRDTYYNNHEEQKRQELQVGYFSNSVYQEENKD